MGNNCPHCGGSLIYDIKSKTIRCSYCNSDFSPESFTVSTAAEEHQADTSPSNGSPQTEAADYDTTIYTCPNCGGEITSLNQAAVDYCMYCGSFVTLTKRMTKMAQPEQILPFSITKEECKKRYQQSLRKKIYAPTEFRNSEFLDGFSGIYIPYWNFSYQYGPELTVKGSSESREGDYKVTQHYTSIVKANGKVSGVTYDASSRFDDSLSAKISPFDGEHMKPFSPAYMFGFYGDLADVKENLYEEEADEEAGNLMWDTVRKNPNLAEGHPESEKPKSLFSDFQIKRESNLAMLPVWFLTWRKGKHVAYSVMNGDSGEIYSEVPIDIRRYLLFSLLTAIPLFFLLEAFMTLTASTMLGLSLILSFLMLTLYTFELDQIVRKVLHTDDKGYLSHNSEAKKASDEQVSDNIIQMFIELLLCFGWFLPLALVLIFFLYTEYAVIALCIMIVFTPLYSIYRIRKDAKILNDSSVWFDCLGAFFSILLSAMILLADPAPDQIYYICSILGMLSVGFTSVRMMKRYNQLITRPLPNFFDRKGGVSHASK